MKKTELKSEPIDRIKLWERLELRLADSQGKAEFITRVENIGKDKFQVECPVKLSGKRNLQPGDVVEAVINRDDASYLFRARIIEIDAARENLTTIKPIGALSRIQRRKFVRLDISFNVNFAVIDMNAPTDSFTGGSYQGQLLNLSAGGVLLSASKKLKEGDYLLLNFKLKPGKDLENIIGVVKRVDAHGDEYLVGIEFLTREQIRDTSHWHLAQFLPPFATYFDDELEKQLVRFIYNEQIMRKRGRTSRE